MSTLIKLSILVRGAVPGDKKTETDKKGGGHQPQRWEGRVRHKPTSTSSSNRNTSNYNPETVRVVGAPKDGGQWGGGPKISRFFFLLPPPFSSRGILVVFEAPGPQMCLFSHSGCPVEAPGGLHGEWSMAQKTRQKQKKCPEEQPHWSRFSRMNHKGFGTKRFDQKRGQKWCGPNVVRKTKNMEKPIKKRNIPLSFTQNSKNRKNISEIQKIGKYTYLLPDQKKSTTKVKNHKKNLKRKKIKLKCCSKKEK